MITVSVPSAYMCRLADGWINLALIRKIEIDNTDFGMVTWSNGEREQFSGEDVQDIIKICEEIEQKFDQGTIEDLEDGN